MFVDPMIHRPRSIRYLAFMLGMLQLAAPGLSAIADGMLARDSAGAPSTHIEATTSASCPFVHSPDCALCRQLSMSALGDGAAPAFVSAASSQCELGSAATIVARSAAVGLPPGRGPPTL
jgi:hypothetical protein